MLRHSGVVRAERQSSLCKKAPARSLEKELQASEAGLAVANDVGILWETTIIATWVDSFSF